MNFHHTEGDEVLSIERSPASLRRIWLWFLPLFILPPGAAQGLRWNVTWTASVQGPYPVGNASAQPDLRFAFPSAATGARDQTFRLIVLPDLWGPQIRLRLSNVFGTRPVTFDGVFAGLHSSGGAIVRG